MARSGSISLQRKYTETTKRRECPDVFIILTFRKPPKKSSGPHRVKSPHPVRQYPFSSAVIFVNGESKAWQDIFDDINLKIKAISMSSLNKNYSTTKEKDKLFRSVQYFFFDKRCGSKLAKRLNNQFFSRTRQPTQVDLDINNKERIVNELRDALECTQFYLKDNDTTCWVRAGSFALSHDHLGENISQICSSAWEIIPDSHTRIISVKLSTSGMEKVIWEKDGEGPVLTPESVKPITQESLS